MTHKTIPYQKFPHWWICWFYEDNFTWNIFTGCLEYHKKIHGLYPYVYFEGKGYLAHRLSYAISRWEDPGDLVVRHLCNNYRCSNPVHLEKGTHAQNGQDMIDSGRSQSGNKHWMKRMPERFAEWREKIRIAGPKNLPPNGETHPATKLNVSKVRDIKQRSANGESTQVLAEAFGVTESNITCIVLGKTWAYVDGPIREKDKRFASKLTPDIVLDIRRKSLTGLSTWKLSKEFGVSSGTIHKIIKWQTWRHVVEEGQIAPPPIMPRSDKRSSKISDSMIEDIKMRGMNNESYASIAKIHGISLSMARAIIVRKP